MTSNGLTELEDLLLTYSGHIDLNSSDTGQYGWGTPTLGGFFTNVFSRETLGLSASNGWNAKLNVVSQKVNAMFQEKRNSAIALGGAPQKLINQQALTPKIYAVQTQKVPYNVNPGQRQFQKASMFYVTVPRN